MLASEEKLERQQSRKMSKISPAPRRQSVFTKGLQNSLLDGSQDKSPNFKKVNSGDKPKIVIESDLYGKQ